MSQSSAVTNEMPQSTGGKGLAAWSKPELRRSDCRDSQSNPANSGLDGYAKS